MTFELFPKAMIRNPNPTVTVAKDRVALRFNAVASKILRDVEALQLLTDHSTGRLAFRPVPLEDPNGYVLSNQGSQSFLTCPAFIKQSGLPESGKWQLAQQGVLLVFDPSALLRTVQGAS